MVKSKIWIFIILIVIIGFISSLYFVLRINNNIKENEVSSEESKIKNNIQVYKDSSEEAKREDYYDENGKYHHYYEVSPYTDNYGYGDNREIACILFNDEREKWDYLPLSDSFKKKYENKKILDDDSIIKFTWSDGYHELMYSLELAENSDEYYTRMISCSKTDGEYAYLFEIDLDKNQKLIEDINVLSVTKLYDNNKGYTNDYYIKINKDNFIMIFESIMFPNIKRPGILDINRHNVALTKNFLDKYGYEKDIIENTTGVPLTRFTLSDEDFENRTFTCTCLYDAINLWKKYEVKFSLTEDGQLETIENVIK